jgi:hypothetical protein
MKIKESVMRDTTFITADPGHATVDKLEDHRLKPKETRTLPGLKKAINHTMVINYTLIPILIIFNTNNENHPYKCTLQPNRPH